MKPLKHATIFVYFIIASVSVHAQTLVLNGTLNSAWHYINGAIASQGATVINPGEYVDLAAQTKITFDPGFKVESGGILRAVVSPDTDTDMILDIVEQRSGCSNYLLEDSDGDGLPDNIEDKNMNGVHEPNQAETLACSKDTDNDGMDDLWEIQKNINPNLNDANEDPDGDGLPNYYEWHFNQSDPLDGNSIPQKGTYYEYDELGRIKKIIRIK